MSDMTPGQEIYKHLYDMPVDDFPNAAPAYIDEQLVALERKIVLREGAAIYKSQMEINWKMYKKEFEKVQELEKQAALAASGRDQLVEALERIQFYFVGYNPEDDLPEDWPRNKDGEPLSCAEITSAALASVEPKKEGA